MHKIEVKELPELDDALAIQVSNDEYQTLEDLRKAIGDNLLENKQRRIRDELREQVVNAVIDQSHFALHPVLIQEEAEDMLHQFTHLLEDQHMSLDQYLLLLKKSREEYLKELEPDAEKRVKRQLVLDEVIKKEEISVVPEEVEALFRAYAQMGQNLPRTEEQIRALARSLLREKAITHLVELAAGPDPASSEEEAGVANAEAAALAGEEEAKNTQEEEESQHEAAEARGTQEEEEAQHEAAETGTTSTGETNVDTGIEVQ